MFLPSPAHCQGPGLIPPLALLVPTLLPTASHVSPSPFLRLLCHSLLTPQQIPLYPLGTNHFYLNFSSWSVSRRGQRDTAAQCGTQEYTRWQRKEWNSLKTTQNILTAQNKGGRTKRDANEKKNHEQQPSSWNLLHSFSISSTRSSHPLILRWWGITPACAKFGFFKLKSSRNRLEKERNLQVTLFLLPSLVWLTHWSLKTTE